MSGYHNIARFPGQPRPATARATAVARAPQSPVGGLGRMPRVPRVPGGAIAGAALLLAAGYAYKYYQYLHTVPPNYTDNGNGTFDVTGFIWPDWNTTRYSSDRTYGYASQVSKNNTLDVDHWRRWHGEYVPNPPWAKGWWYHTAWFPPTYFGVRGPATRNGPFIGVQIQPSEAAEPGRDREPLPLFPPVPSDAPVRAIDWGTDIMTGRRNPVPAISERPGTALAFRYSNISSDAAAAAVPATANLPELKLQASAAVTVMINRFFRLGGELQDFTRCFVFGMGFTYQNRNGVERTIPKDQWLEYLAREIKIRNSPSIGKRLVSKRAEKIHRSYTDRFSADEKAVRFLKCIVRNHLEDKIIGAAGRAKRDMASQLGIFAGPLGLDSQILLAEGHIPYENLL